MLAKYAGQPLPLSLHHDDLEALRAWTAAAIDSALQLDRWGGDAFIARAVAYATLVLSFRVSGFAVVDVEQLR